MRRASYSHKKILCRAALLALMGLIAQPAFSWVRPEAPTKAKPAPAAQRLDYVVIAVNGKPRLVRAGDELAVVRGDQIVVQDGALADKQKPKELDVIGWKAKRALNNDDRGQAIDTADLALKYSEHEKGELWAVLAQSRKTLHGAVYLKVIDPVLRYAEISVNGARRVLRDGEPLAVKGSDQVKVEKVATNLESTDGVVFQIVGDPARGGDAYEIRFLRSGLAFARIPLTVAADAK